MFSVKMVYYFVESDYVPCISSCMNPAFSHQLNCSLLELQTKQVELCELFLVLTAAVGSGSLEKTDTVRCFVIVEHSEPTR